MISQIKTLWKLVSGEIKDVFDAIAINTTTRQVKTGSHEINSSVERGSAGEEYDLLQYASDSTATHDQFAIKGVVPTTQDYAEAWGGEDASGQWGKGFILKHDKTNKKFKFQYSTSGKNDGTETDIMSLADSGAIDLGSNNLTTTGTLSSGGETIVKNALGTTSTDGQVITNNTLAVIGTTVQMSPRVRLSGSAWDTDDAVSRTSDWIIENLPATDNTVFSTLRFGHSLAGGSFTYPFGFRNNGSIYIANTGHIYNSIDTYFDLYVGAATAPAYIRRNTADANSAFVINNANASSTGNICNFQWQSVNRAFVDRHGIYASYGYDLPHVVKKAASANIRNSHDAEATSTSADYVKVKTITLTYGLVGIARFLFDLKTSDSVTPTPAYGRIYRNGVALGTEQTDVTGGYVAKSEDITQNWSPGDTVELWVKIAGGNTVSVQNFRIAYDDAPSITVASVNS
jgi:hypothetical protein